MSELTVVTRGYTRSERHITLLARNESDHIVSGLIIDVGNADLARIVGNSWIEALKLAGHSVTLTSSAKLAIGMEAGNE